MDVSNSTGQNTGYRVMGSGGNAPMGNELVATSIILEPEQREKCRFPIPCGSFRVLFTNNEGVEVACATFHQEPVLVRLKEDECGIWVQPENGSTGEITL